jgi:hypothetical protein
MSEIGEIYGAMKEASQEKRANNRQSSAEILKNKGVEFESKNLGAHLIVTGKKGLIDFWPGTGKFIPRNGGRNGRGVFNLLKLCQVNGQCA